MISPGIVAEQLARSLRWSISESPPPSPLPWRLHLLGDFRCQLLIAGAPRGETTQPPQSATRLKRLGFGICFFVLRTPLLDLYLKLLELRLQSFLLFRPLLQCLCKFHNLVLEAVGDLLEFRHRARLSRKDFELFLHEASCARLHEDYTSCNGSVGTTV